jgi:type VI secretion system protein ImpK
MTNDQPIQKPSNPDPFYYLCQHFSQRKEGGYHRSKIYSPSHTQGQHALIAAAGPLFALIHRSHLVSTQSTRKPIAIEHWQHEMQAFIDHATASGYSDKTIAAASFALTALIDEKLKSGQTSDQTNTSLLPDTISGKHQANLFFDLIGACQNDPGNHLNLIELLYLCIENGYTGHYDQHHQGLHQLAHISHQLFTTIVQHQSVNPIPSIPQHDTTTPIKRSCWKKAMMWVWIFGLSFSLAGYYGWQHSHTQPSDLLQAKSQPPNHIVEA